MEREAINNNSVIMEYTSNDSQNTSEIEKEAIEKISKTDNALIQQISNNTLNENKKYKNVETKVKQENCQK